MTHAAMIDRVNIAYGKGSGLTADAYKISLTKDWSAVWLKDYWWQITGYWEASAGYIDDTDNDDGENNSYVFAVTPVFVFQKATPLFFTIKPFFELGIGASIFTETTVDDRKISTAFQFEDRAGVGFTFGAGNQFYAKYNFIHYSNASIERPNQGVNMNWFTLGYHF